MNPPTVTASGATSSRTSWGLPLLLGVAAVVVPVGSAAQWLGGAHGATAAELRSGVWLFKSSLLALAAATFILGRLSAADWWRTRGVTTDLVHRPLDRRTMMLLGAVLALATVLRLNHLNTELWQDEIDSLSRYITLRVPQILGTYDTQNEHPLYSLLAHATRAPGGGADWTIRLPAVAFGIASLWATFVFARRIASDAEALLAVLFLSLSYHHVWFSQNARGYTAILFFTLATSSLFLRLMEDDSKHPSRLVWSYALLMALAVYTHLTAALVAVGHTLALLVDAAWRRRTAGWSARSLLRPAAAIVLSGLLSLCLYAVVVPQLLGELLKPTMQGVEVEWTSAHWMLTETLRVLATGMPGGLVSISAALAVLLIGFVSYWKESRRVALVMFAPVVVTAAGVLALRHNLWPRFFFFAASFFVLVALRGGFVISRWIFRGTGERVAVAGAFAVACLSGFTVPRAWQPKQQFGAAARYVDAQRSPGDVVVAVDAAAYVYSLYHTPPDWRLALDPKSFQDAERGSSRLWVVYTLPTRLRALFPELARHLEAPPYRELHVFPSTVGGGEIHVLRRDAPTTP